MGGHKDDEDERRRCGVEGMDGPYTGPKQEAAAAMGWLVFIGCVVVIITGASIWSWWTKRKQIREDMAYEARHAPPTPAAVGPAAT